MQPVLLQDAPALGPKPFATAHEKAGRVFDMLQQIRGHVNAWDSTATTFAFIVEMWRDWDGVRNGAMQLRSCFSLFLLNSRKAKGMMNIESSLRILPCFLLNEKLLPCKRRTSKLHL